MSFSVAGLLLMCGLKIDNKKPGYLVIFPGLFKQTRRILGFKNS